VPIAQQLLDRTVGDPVGTEPDDKFFEFWGQLAVALGFGPKVVGIYTQRIIALDVHAMTRFYRFPKELLVYKVSSSDYAVFF
jgi:hypothetical protein